MIKEELLENNRVRHYSDNGFKIKQVETGAIYEDAVDVIPCKYTYVETDEKIEIESEVEDGNIRNIEIDRV